MSKLVFRNYNKKAIKNLMREMGKERFECALKDSGMPNKPDSMEGFYLEFRVPEQDHYLIYMYPSETTFELMVVNGFWAIPQEGWELKRVEV